MTNDIFLYDKSDQLFAQQLSSQINLDFIPYELSKFNNGELFVKIPYDVKDRNVFILVKTSKEIQNFQDIIFVVVEVYNKKAKSINVISFYIPYLRQFSKEKSKNIFDIMAKTIFYAGADKIITLDPHCNDFLKSYGDKISIISAKNIFIEKIKSLNLDDFCFISPDLGAKEINSYIAKYFHTKVFIAEKIRNKESGKIETLNLFEENLNFKNIIIVEDMIDSGQTIHLLINLILEKNPRVNIFIFCSHPIFSKPLSFLEIEQVKFLFTTDSINNSDLQNKKIVVESLENILVDFIKNFQK